MSNESKRVLIADDCQAVRAAVRFLLERQPALEVCGEAVDGMDAIEKARMLNPDLIILDLAMPVMDGAAAARVLKSSKPDVPIVLFTLYEEAVECYAAVRGVDVVLSKPSGMMQLVGRVQSLLERAAPVA